MEQNFNFILWGGRGDVFDTIENRPLIEQSLKDVFDTKKPRVLIISTANGDNERQKSIYHQAFGAVGCITEHLDVFPYKDVEYKQKINRSDLVWVCGGSTQNLYALWISHGLDKEIVDYATATDCVLGGTSAGMNIWFDTSITWSGGSFSLFQGGLGLIRGNGCPHADSQPQRLKVLNSCINEKKQVGTTYALGENTVCNMQVNKVTNKIENQTLFCPKGESPFFKIINSS